MSAPDFVLIAGPNGAGKSTAAPGLLRDQRGSIEFINADDIARGLSAFQPESVAVAAGRILLDRVRSLSRAGRSFAVETTLSGRTYLRHIEEYKERGYKVSIFFLWLPSPELALHRVRQRVLLGGHNIPEDVIRRRYSAGLSNFLGPYREAVDFWRLYDGSGPTPKLIAHGSGETELVNDEPLWHTVQGDRL